VRNNKKLTQGQISVDPECYTEELCVAASRPVIVNNYFANETQRVLAADPWIYLL
jgi:hypothetical protein